MVDTRGFLTKETDPRTNQAFRTTYDSSGRVTDQYDAFDNHSTSDTGSTTFKDSFRVCLKLMAGRSRSPTCQRVVQKPRQSRCSQTTSRTM